MANFLGTNYSIQVHKKVKFSRRDNSSLAVKGLNNNIKKKLVYSFQKVVKNHNFVTASQIDEDKEVVEMAEKSIKYRDQLQGDEHEVSHVSFLLIIYHIIFVIIQIVFTDECEIRKT